MDEHTEWTAGAPASADPPPAPPPDPATTASPLDGAALDRLIQSARTLASTSPDRCDDEQLEAFTMALEQARRALDTASAKVIGEMDARSSTDRRHGHTTKSWLGAAQHLPGDVATRRVKVARLLRCCPILEQAMTAGAIGFEHVRVVANATTVRNLDAVIDLQRQLVDMVGELPVFRTWAARVTDLLRVADGPRAEPRPADRSLRFEPRPDGSVGLTGTLTEGDRHIVDHVLGRIADRLFRQFSEDARNAPNDCEIPDRSALMGLALVEACRIAAAAGRDGSGTVAEVVYVIHSDDPATVWTPDGQRVDHHTAQVACCDGSFHPLVMDEFGVPLDAGRAARFADRTQRRAAHARDGGCVFPGCGAQASHTDLHHVDHWEHDGHSDMANFACLCRHHHGVVHRDGWSMRTVEHQWFEFTTPAGEVLMSQRHGDAVPAAA